MMIIKTNIVNYKYFTNIFPSEKIIFTGLDSLIDTPCDCIILMLSDILTVSHVYYLEKLYNFVKSNSSVPCYLIGVGCTLKDCNYNKYINKKRDVLIKKLFSEIISRSSSLGVREKITKQWLVDYFGYNSEKIDVIFEKNNSSDKNLNLIDVFIRKNFPDNPIPIQYYMTYQLKHIEYAKEEIYEELNRLNIILCPPNSQYKIINEFCSIGISCEPAFRLKHHFGYVNSYVFNWVAVGDLDKYYKTLRDPFIMLSEGASPPSGRILMIHDVASDVLIHVKQYAKSYEDMFEKGMSSDSPKIVSNFIMNRLKEKFKHLSAKQEMLFNSNKKVLFVLKVNFEVNQGISEIIIEKTKKFINNVYNIIKQKKNDGRFYLLCVVKNDIVNLLTDIHKDGLIIRSVDHFTTAGQGQESTDILGWENILSEFRLCKT